jgi:hypothetical protein
MRKLKCVMCDEATKYNECLYAIDFKMRGPDVPICKVCENDNTKYTHASIYAQAVLWVGK